MSDLIRADGLPLAPDSRSRSRSQPRSGSGDAIRAWFRVPPASERVRSWHVSPAIDMAAYHFSWLWVLVPLALAGPAFPDDYIRLYMVVLAFGFIHRHYMLGYAYLDPEIFAAHRKPFIWTPILLALGLAATPILLRAKIPPGAISFGDFSWPASMLRIKLIMTTIVVIAGIWNIWHTLAQKYGILRIYSAKARGESEQAGTPNEGVPGWVDRLFVMGWLPLIVTYVAPPFTRMLLHEWRVARPFLKPLLVFLDAASPILVPLSFSFAFGAVATWCVFEWRVHHFRIRPRLSMGLGLFALWACFLVIDPVKVYMAFAFSHGLEYMVFVWAFQRRRYAERRDPQPPMARILEYPWIAYPAYTLALGALYVGLQDWPGPDFWDVPDERVFSMSLSKWVFYWGVFQSLQHFYYDGFLWKTRSPTLRQSL